MSTHPIGLPSSNPKTWLQNAAVNIPGMVECVYEPIYDSTVVPAGGSESITLFQEPIGFGPKKLVDTNMDLSGQLSAGTRFLVLGIELAFFSGAISASPAFDSNSLLVEDVYGFYKSGALKFKIQSKEYLVNAPLGRFPPATKVQSDLWMQGQGVTSNLMSYASLSGRPFAMIGKTLIANQNFSVELLGIPVLPSGFDGRVYARLIGFRGRNAQ